jgi:two-component system, chemotaxis family, chemotaxis protein CheY
MNVLVVDDSKVMRMKLKSLIEGAGVPITSVVEAEHGGQALAKFEGAKFDVVFTDINMPEMDGRELLKQLAAKKLSPAPFLVVCTTETPQSLRDELNGYGVGLYVEKPFSPEVVKQALGAVLAKK